MRIPSAAHPDLELLGARRIYALFLKNLSPQVIWRGSPKASSKAFSLLRLLQVHESQLGLSLVLFPIRHSLLCT